MAGDIKAKFGTQGTLTFTSFNSKAGDSTFLAGSSSAAVDNGSANVALDYLFSSKITWSSTGASAGTLRLDFHVYGNLNDTPDYPLDGSGNVLGTDTGRTFATDGDKANGTAFVQSLTITASQANKVYTLDPVGLAQFFGGQMPKWWGIWAVHGSTTANATPASSGNTYWYMPVLAQYT
jgi:hypothetical protein